MLDRLNHRRQEASLHPHDWHFKSKRSKKSRSGSSSSSITFPSPTIFRDVVPPYSLKQNSTAPPTIETYPAPGHIASALLFVECVHELRRQVEASPRLQEAFTARPSLIRDSKTESVVWQSYLHIAVKRFKLWITSIESIIRHSAVFNRYGNGSHLQGAFTEHYLPPLDVLLVWYCYLQDSTAYERLLASNEFSLLHDICFPWHLLPTSIDQDTLEYTLTGPARRLWDNFASIPVDLEDCIDLDLEDVSTAFTSHDKELLDLALRHTETMDKINEHKWLRSPSVRGTIERASTRYATACTRGQISPSEAPTQQIPMPSGENRDLKTLHLDIAAQLVLQTHKGYHAAWKSFAQLYNLRDDRDEGAALPPSYEESNAKDTEAGFAGPISISESELESDTCFCWICERIRDEIDGVSGSPAVPQVTSLTRIDSPDEMDKMSVASSSSSDTNGSDPPAYLGLSRKQRKAIKKEIEMYRSVEEWREKRMLAVRSY